MFCQQGVLKNFEKFTGKHLCQSLASACNFITKETMTQVFSCEFCGIFKNIYFIEHLRWLPLSERKPRTNLCVYSSREIRFKAPQRSVKIKIQLNVMYGMGRVKRVFCIPVQLLRSWMDGPFKNTQFMPLISIDTPWKYQKIFDFQEVSKETVAWNGLTSFMKNIFL